MMKRRASALVLLLLTGCGSSHYQWQDGDRRYLVVEDGRPIEVTEVSIREPYTTPFVTHWHYILLETNGTTRRPDRDLRWPMDYGWQRATIPDAALRALADNTPLHRRSDAVLTDAATGFNRGGVGQAWVLALRPLTIALTFEPDSGPSPLPLPGSGPCFGYLPAGPTQLIDTANLHSSVSAVVVLDRFSDKPDLFPRGSGRLFLLRKPTSLDQLLKAVAMPNEMALVQLAERVKPLTMGMSSEPSAP